MYSSTKPIESLIQRLPQEQQDLFFSFGKERHFPTGEFLLREGSVCNDLFIVTSGIIRSFRTFQRGDTVLDVTSSFAFPGDFDTSPRSLIHKLPSLDALQAITPVTVIAFEYWNLNDAMASFQEYQALIFDALLDYLITLQAHLFEFKVLSAKERYEKLLNEHPEFVRDIPLKYLASYLNMKKETLSRIRGM